MEKSTKYGKSTEFRFSNFGKWKVNIYAQIYIYIYIYIYIFFLFFFFVFVCFDLLLLLLFLIWFLPNYLLSVLIKIFASVLSTGKLPV